MESAESATPWPLAHIAPRPNCSVRCCSESSPFPRLALKSPMGLYVFTFVVYPRLIHRKKTFSCLSSASEVPPPPARAAATPNMHFLLIGGKDTQVRGEDSDRCLRLTAHPRPLLPRPAGTACLFPLRGQCFTQPLSSTPKTQTRKRQPPQRAVPSCQTPQS